MIYLLCLIVALNLILLFEVISLAIKEQRARGLDVGYSKTILLYIVVTLVLFALVYFAVRYVGLG